MSSHIVVPTQQMVEAEEGFTLKIGRKPEAVVAEARMCAEALVAAVKRNNWMQKFGGKEHLFFEAWAFLASMYRVVPRVNRTQLIQIGDVTGYEAYAEAFHVPSGIVISTAESMCLDDEDNWDMRPEYGYQGEGANRKRVIVGEKAVPLFQLRSMAQTRAMSKALRGPFSWIVAMAGYAPTPKEEMTGSERSSHTQQGAPAPQQQQQTNGGANGGSNLISEPQKKRLYAIAKGRNMPDAVLNELVGAYGFKRSDEITRAKYEEIVAVVEGWEPV